MRRAYLTRALPPGSPLPEVARKAGYELRAEATLAIRYLPFDYPQDADWLFAYSAHAVQGFLQRLGARTWLAEHPAIKFGAIGEGTAAAWRAAGFKPDFVGTGDPDTVGQVFAGRADGRHVAFLQAQESRESIAQRLPPSVAVTPLPTYRTDPKRDLRPESAEVALLTSPKSAEAFLGAYAKTQGAGAVQELRLYCIGATTATAVGAAGYQVAGTPGEVTVRGLVEMLFEVGR